MAKYVKTEEGYKLGNELWMPAKNPVGTGTFSMNRKAGTTIGSRSHAEGSNTTASGFTSHAEGSNTAAYSDYSHAEGEYTKVTNDSTTKSIYTTTTTKGYAGHAEGYGSVAYGTVSHAEGNGTYASGDYSHAEGYITTASGRSSHAEGQNTTASNYYSHAEGQGSIASGMRSHAEGSSTTASGNGSHAEGLLTLASGNNSHAEGEYTIASGNNSHAEGYYTKAPSSYQHVQGKHNIEDTNGVYQHIVGNGTLSTKKSNAHTLDWQGNAWFAGDIYVGSTSGTNRDEGSKRVLTADDRTHYVYYADTEFNATLEGSLSVDQENISGVGWLAEILENHYDTCTYTMTCSWESDTYTATSVTKNQTMSSSVLTIGFKNGRTVMLDLNTKNDKIHMMYNGITGIGNIYINISGTYPKETVHKLDSKYLPEECLNSNAINVPTATVGQTIVVSEVDENGKPIAWEAVDAQSDWNQNDPNAPDYVANRPCWVDDPEETVVFDGEYVNDSEFECSPTVGLEYEITLDGIKYNLIAQEWEGECCVGSYSLWNEDDYVDTEPPFVWGDGWFYTVNDGDTHTLKIVEIAKEYHKIDEIYLPDNITKNVVPYIGDFYTTDVNISRMETGDFAKVKIYSQEFPIGNVPDCCSFTVNTGSGRMFTFTRLNARNMVMTSDVITMPGNSTTPNKLAVATLNEYTGDVTVCCIFSASKDVTDTAT